MDKLPATPPVNRTLPFSQSLSHKRVGASSGGGGTNSIY
jgi:hypothetical protein